MDTIVPKVTIIERETIKDVSYISMEVVRNITTTKGSMVEGFTHKITLFLYILSVWTKSFYVIIQNLMFVIIKS